MMRRGHDSNTYAAETIVVPTAHATSSTVEYTFTASHDYDRHVESGVNGEVDANPEGYL